MHPAHTLYTFPHFSEFKPAPIKHDLNKDARMTTMDNNNNDDDECNDDHNKSQQ
jgi:hypothetical protein